MSNSEEFEREKICYEQNFQQARSLNTQMNHVPVLAMTLTGGLWFAAGVTENITPEIRFFLLIFAGLCNLSLILVTIRTRDVFHSYLESIKAFHPPGFANGKPVDPKAPALGDYSMISIYCALMMIAAILSFGVAVFKYWPLTYIPSWVGALGLLVLLVLLYDFLISNKLIGSSKKRSSDDQSDEKA